jgi:hypothetical protein
VRAGQIQSLVEDHIPALLQILGLGAKTLWQGERAAADSRRQDGRLELGTSPSSCVIEVNLHVKTQFLEKNRLRLPE